MGELKTKEDYIKRYDRVISWSEEDKAYLVRFVELPGCVTHGSTLAEAFKMSDEAAAAYLSMFDDEGKPYPVPAVMSREIKNFQLRMELPKFQFLKLISEEMGMSINDTILKILDQPNFQFYSRTSPDIEAKKKLTEAIFGRKLKDVKKSIKKKVDRKHVKAKETHHSKRKRA